MSVEIRYSRHAVTFLQKTENVIRKRIIGKIKKNATTSPLANAKELSGVFSGLYRYRIGNYRVIFEYNESGELIILTILKIGHRKDIYK